MAAGRRALCAELAKHDVDQQVIDSVELMASELLTNAVLHAGGDLRLVLSLDDDLIRVEVRDQSSAPPMLRHPPPDASSGRGIAIVDALASAWGVREMAGGGKSVWFEVSR